jgi:hypothetical protein
MAPQRCNRAHQGASVATFAFEVAATPERLAGRQRDSRRRRRRKFILTETQSASGAFSGMVEFVTKPQPSDIKPKV